jgi:sterol desaturase/sphingolipid hydroxylase (fatty acid hydroxylase superfamily)
MDLSAITLPTVLTILSTIVFLFIERLWPGRDLPKVRGWYVRAILINLVQLTITVGLARLWREVYGHASVLNLSTLEIPVLEGFVGWFVGTFVFYWWHRLRHQKGFWRVFHQIHHSPSRIEVVTSFYKHPIEIATNSFLSAFILVPGLGCSLLGVFWYNFFAATGEYFYHANFRSPKWLRYFIQTPELHSIHHQLDVHNFNFSDIPIWDRMFGTYRDTTEFMTRCGFPGSNEERIAEMLVFKDVYDPALAR